MNGDHPDRDDLVAYSLGALEPLQRRDVEAHAPSCARCSRELEALVPAVGVLAESVEQLEPPSELRERVLGTVRAEAAAKPTEGGDPGPGEEAAGPRRSRHGLRGFMLRPASALAALAIAAAGIAGYLIAENGGGGGGGAITVPVVAESGIGGTLAVADPSSTLELHGLEQLTGSQVYQVWVAQGSTLRPSSSFIPDGSGRASTAVDGHLAPGAKVMVTREPRAGRTKPTPPILLTATVQ